MRRLHLYPEAGHGRGPVAQGDREQVKALNVLIKLYNGKARQAPWCIESARDLREAINGAARAMRWPEPAEVMRAEPLTRIEAESRPCPKHSPTFTGPAAPGAACLCPATLRRGV